MKNIDIESFFMGLIAGAVIIALVAMLATPCGNQDGQGPQGIIITSLESVITHEGRTLWYVDYILNGEVQPSVICPTEAYARRLIDYLREYRAAQWIQE
jgi:hypothetical protein